MDKIELKSRYDDILTELEFIEEDRGIITTNGSYVRVTTKAGDTSGKYIVAIDFEGGPEISVGSIVGKTKQVKAIKPAYIIEFEK